MDKTSIVITVIFVVVVLAIVVSVVRALIEARKRYQALVQDEAACLPVSVAERVAAAVEQGHPGGPGANQMLEP